MNATLAPSNWDLLPPTVRTALQSRLEALQSLEGWATLQKREHLARLVIDHNAMRCVEIGVFGGQSLLAIALATELLPDGDRAQVVGYDPYTKEAALEGDNDKANDEWWSKLDLAAIHRSALEAIGSLGLSSRCQIRTKTDIEAADDFTNGTVDLLHLDANHAKAISLRSAALWLPKVRAGGIVIQDDCNWDSVKPTVAWLDEQATRLEWPEGATWGAWVV